MPKSTSDSCCDDASSNWSPHLTLTRYSARQRQTPQQNRHASLTTSRDKRACHPSGSRPHPRPAPPPDHPLLPPLLSSSAGSRLVRSEEDTLRLRSSCAFVVYGRRARPGRRLAVRPHYLLLTAWFAPDGRLTLSRPGFLGRAQL